MAAMTSLDPVQTWRKAVVRVTIASFSVAAVMGIVVLLGGRTFGPVQGKVIGTTAGVGVVSLAMLCYLMAGGRRWVALGVLGAVAALAAFCAMEANVWFGLEHLRWVNRTGASTGLVAATIAQQCLLLSARPFPQRIGRLFVVTSVSLATLVAAMLLPFVVTDGDFQVGTWYWRSFGVIAILDALASVIVLALSLFGGRGRQSQPAQWNGVLAPEVAAQISQRAAAAGISPDAYLAGLLNGVEG